MPGGYGAADAVEEGAEDIAGGGGALRILDGDLGERDGDLRAGVANVE